MEIDLRKTKTTNAKLNKEMWKCMIIPYFRKLVLGSVVILFLFNSCISWFLNDKGGLVNHIIAILLTCILMEILLKVYLLLGLPNRFAEFRKKRGLFNADKKVAIVEDKIIMDDVVSYSNRQLKCCKITDIALMMKIGKYFVALPRDCFTSEDIRAFEEWRSRNS